jgi:hypothetical protein
LRWALCTSQNSLSRHLREDSGGLLDGWVALRPARSPSFGPSRRASTGFRWLGGRPKIRQKRQNDAMDPYRCQVSPIVVPLPRQPQVRNARSRQPKRVKAATTQLHRSACSGWRTRGMLHPKVCLRKRKVCRALRALDCSIVETHHAPSSCSLHPLTACAVKTQAKRLRQ